MSNLVLPPEERRVAANKPISPLAIDPPVLADDQGIRPWASLAEIPIHAASIRKLAADQGHWIHDPAFRIPEGRITDLDYCMAVITSAWIHAHAPTGTEDELLHARGFGASVFLAVDVIRTVVKHGMFHGAKHRLMNYWGTPFTTSPRYPDNWHKPFLNNVRKLGRSGFIALTKPLDDAGKMRYLVAPSQAGFVRAVWIANQIGEQSPIDQAIELLKAHPRLPTARDVSATPSAKRVASDGSQRPQVHENATDDPVSKHTVVAIAIGVQQRQALAQPHIVTAKKSRPRKSLAAAKPSKSKSKSAKSIKRPKKKK